MDQAYKILQWVCRYLPKIYSFLGATDVGRDGRMIQEIILAAGGRIEKSALTRKMLNKLSSEELEKRIKTLMEGGLIKKFHTSMLEPGPDKGRIVYELSLPPEEELQ